MSTFEPEYQSVYIGGQPKAVQPGADVDSDEDPKYLDETNARQEDFDRAWAEAAEVNPTLDASPTDYGRLP